MVRALWSDQVEIYFVHPRRLDDGLGGEGLIQGESEPVDGQLHLAGHDVRCGIDQVCRALLSVKSYSTLSRVVVSAPPGLAPSVLRLTAVTSCIPPRPWGPLCCVEVLADDEVVEWAELQPLTTRAADNKAPDVTARRLCMGLLCRGRRCPPALVLVYRALL